MVDRYIAPQFFEPDKINLKEPKIVKFDNGSRFFGLNISEQPVIRIEFIFEAGIWYESSPGIAFLTGKMLPEGTKSFSSGQLAERFEKYGAFVEINPGFDYINLSIHLPTRHFEKVLDPIEELLFKPKFPEEELELLKKIQIQQLKVNEQKNNFVAGRLFRSNLYRNVPYGNLVTSESYKQMDTNDLRNHFEKWMNGKFDCFVTGNFDEGIEQRIRFLLRENLNERTDFMPSNSVNGSSFNKYLEKKGSLQSSIFMGKRCIDRSDKKFPDLLVLNEVFGGYFGSRLMQNIRELKGYTYNIYSHLVTLKNDAYFVINSEVNKEHKDEAIDEIIKEINTIKKELIGKEELHKVKNYLKGSLINSLTSPFAITEKLKNIYFYELDTDYYKILFDRIDAIDASELLNLANTHLFNEPLSSVVVG